MLAEGGGEWIQLSLIHEISSQKIHVHLKKSNFFFLRFTEKLKELRINLVEIFSAVVSKKIVNFLMVLGF